MKRRDVLTAGAACTVAGLAVGREAPKPMLTVVLMAASREVQRLTLSEGQILGLPQSRITTATSWTERSEFVGPELEVLARSVGAARFSNFRLNAANGYATTIGEADIRRFKPILAHSQNDRRLSLRDFGPLWVIFPRDDFPQELNAVTVDAKFIWQVEHITVSG